MIDGCSKSKTGMNCVSGFQNTGSYTLAPDGRRAVSGPLGTIVGET